MAAYICEVCDYIYDEDKEGVKWEDLPDDWVCPVCDASKDYFQKVTAEKVETGADYKSAGSPAESIDKYRRTSDELETLMSDIHLMAETGQSITEPMRTKKPVVLWDDILIKGAQLAKMPLNESEQVSTTTVIGPRAKHPMVLETPVYVSHMSYGALSREVKIAMAKGSAAVKTAMCSGEGGILPESMDASYKYIFEYVPNKYSATPENLKKVDAIEIKFGQSSKPGMGGHLPGNKVTAEIAAIRNRPEGCDVISPARFDDISNATDLKKKVSYLRKESGGKPVGIKIAAGNIEEDLKIIIQTDPDFITIDGRPGATGSSPKYIKAATSVPTIYALYRARRFLDKNKRDDISLVITGGLRVSPDFAKAIALGADAVAIATSVMIACGCQQYRVCHTGKCPVGIATQDENLRKRLDIEKAARNLENFLNVCTEELRLFGRLTGNSNIHDLKISDLCTTNSEISSHTEIEHV